MFRVTSFFIGPIITNMLIRQVIDGIGKIGFKTSIKSFVQLAVFVFILLLSYLTWLVS